MTAAPLPTPRIEQPEVAAGLIKVAKPYLESLFLSSQAVDVLGSRTFTRKQTATTMVWWFEDAPDVRRILRLSA